MKIFLCNFLIIFLGVSADSNFIRRVRQCKLNGKNGCSQSECCDPTASCSDNRCVADGGGPGPSPTAEPPTNEPPTDDESCVPKHGNCKGKNRVCCNGLQCADRTCVAPPSASPTMFPTVSSVPSSEPSEPPSEAPSSSPSDLPTGPPTKSSAPSSEPSESPSEAPSSSPSSGPPTVTYFPGDMSDGKTSTDGKLTLSNGLSARNLTAAGQVVQFDLGGTSTEMFHTKADGATVIPHPTEDGWYYLSNSEEGSDNGGVGTIRFDANGNVIDYSMMLEGTSRNCGGGRSPWNTWLSAEEAGSSGFVYEVDPVNPANNQLTSLVDIGGNYESVAYEIYNVEGNDRVRFFTTEDSSNGALVRYTPCEDAYAACPAGELCRELINSIEVSERCPAGYNAYDYLVLEGTSTEGTYRWTSDRNEAEGSASVTYPQTEGIDFFNGELFFVSKSHRRLYELDLSGNAWNSTSTLSGAFNLQPDQLARVISDREVLYFCEDGGGASDIHGRDLTGQFYTIVNGTGWSTETTGLAFSPDYMFMYVAFQGPSVIYEIKRDDGLPFSGEVAGTKYH